MSVMGFQNKVWMGGGLVGGVSSIQFHFGFFEKKTNFANPLHSRGVTPWTSRATLINITVIKICVLCLIDHEIVFKLITHKG